jgi:hypothetical protein
LENAIDINLYFMISVSVGKEFNDFISEEV